MLDTDAARWSKIHRWRKHNGIATFVPYETSGVREHLTRLRCKGMTPADMAAQSGVSVARIRDLADGVSRDPDRTLSLIRVTTQVKLLSVYYTEPSARGARMSPLGTQRRLQAMQADGYPYWLIAELLGRKDKHAPDRLRELTLGYGRRWKFIHYTTYRKVADVYTQTLAKWPADFGVSSRGAGVVKGKAKLRGWVPRGCWDADTIDEPEAFPEWTGECGTPAGFRIHYREHILPVCDPCRTAKCEYDREYRTR